MKSVAETSERSGPFGSGKIRRIGVDAISHAGLVARQKGRGDPLRKREILDLLVALRSPRSGDLRRLARRLGWLRSTCRLFLAVIVRIGARPSTNRRLAGELPNLSEFGRVSTSLTIRNMGL
jgi:hypothetical protein